MEDLAVFRVTSLPVCWDTLRARTNEGYFDFRQLASFAQIKSGYKSVLAIILGLFADTTCPFYIKNYVAVTASVQKLQADLFLCIIVSLYYSAT
jgi:hypothetical protein